MNDYVKKAIALYCATPGTLGRPRPADRRLAAELYARGISLSSIEQAFILAASRRSFRALDAPPLAPIRSLHYFLPLIEEVLNRPLDPAYVEYLKSKLNNLCK
jgi:hypothetical protein